MKNKINAKAQISNVKSMTKSKCQKSFYLKFNHLDFIWNLKFGFCHFKASFLFKALETNQK
ncbi:MAG: hypothetical protein UU65_C0003G0159 [candidate division CPR2 bacterium GW2011_GWC1_41_48]|uniref:Uncharacterized protein n=1 Tax=candidate division CPR2 bacterium GW2011_GWC1_41_48 TaxID=1618344 RepID=A0A0G0W7Z5_UNCC2|nr:MAG: hypothetical protein UT47_C0003G0165 [candidate division CPR2 bacterium GW2011_GWC2_39_35]KKS09104.1 MAG: hypothetical protein UU65_C0003G0159 [candidate division CPR2 bacterium GW2011_GWC1_41_48]